MELYIFAYLLSLESEHEDIYHSRTFHIVLKVLYHTDAGGLINDSMGQTKSLAVRFTAVVQAKDLH